MKMPNRFMKNGLTLSIKWQSALNKTACRFHANELLLSKQIHFRTFAPRYYN